MFKKLLCRWQCAYRARAANRRDYRELNGLSDHMLKDIGICRSDLLAIKYGESLSNSSNEEELHPHNECSAIFPRLHAIGECNV
jgi:uncharacterized protein YjiS (DUF1127 family)